MVVPGYASYTSSTGVHRARQAGNTTTIDACCGEDTIMLKAKSSRNFGQNYTRSSNRNLTLSKNLKRLRPR